ncbi:hypothetical protein ACF0H5_002437 [Mactra antiquata]
MGRTNRCNNHQNVARGSLNGLHTYRGPYLHYIASMEKARNYLQTYCSHSTKPVWNKIFTSKKPSVANTGQCFCEGFGEASTIFSYAGEPSCDVINDEANEVICDSTPLTIASEESKTDYQPVTVSMATHQSVEDVKIKIEISKIKKLSNATSGCVSHEVARIPHSSGRSLNDVPSIISNYDNKLDYNNVDESCLADLNHNNNARGAEGLNFSYSKPNDQKPRPLSCSNETSRIMNNFDSVHAMNNNFSTSVCYPLPINKHSVFHCPGINDNQEYRNPYQTSQTTSSVLKVDFDHHWNQNRPRQLDNHFDSCSINNNMAAGYLPKCDNKHLQFHSLVSQDDSSRYHCAQKDNSYSPPCERCSNDVRGFPTNQYMSYYNNNAGGAGMLFSGY